MREPPDTLGVGSGALEGSRSKLSAEESAEGNERERKERYTGRSVKQMEQLVWQPRGKRAHEAPKGQGGK